MKLHRYVLGTIVALAALTGGSLPAAAQQMDADRVAEADLRAFNMPTAMPLGQGWYAAASTTTQDAWMATGAPWSDDLMAVRGVARVALIDGDVRPVGAAMAAAPCDTGAADRLVTGVAQWVVPTDNSVWEVRFIGLDRTALFGGAGIMRVLYGETGRGAAQFPRALSYLALYGPVDVYRNGQRIATGLPGHLAVTQGIRLPDTGRLLDTPNVRDEDIQVHVLVQGPIPGLLQEALYVLWPYATLDLRNLSSPVALLPSEIETARAFFAAPAVVAGFREEVVITPRLLIISLRDRFMARSNPEIPPGEVLLQVENDSERARGFYIQGPGVEERTGLLQPGERAAIRLTLQPGTYRIASFTTPTPMMRDYMHWDTIIVR